MPLQIPSIDNRRYQDLLNEALARIPVHNPEWTNFNKSDPGVTLVELFAFLTEALVYRANQIPERSRRKFLSLLGVPIAPASSARGIVAFANERGPLQTTTVDAGLEVRAGQVPFRTERAPSWPARRSRSASSPSSPTRALRSVPARSRRRPTRGSTTSSRSRRRTASSRRTSPSASRPTPRSSRGRR